MKKPSVCGIGRKMGPGWARCGLRRKDIWAPGSKEHTEAADWKEEGKSSGGRSPRGLIPPLRMNRGLRGDLLLAYVPEASCTHIPKCF